MWMDERRTNKTSYFQNAESERRRRTKKITQILSNAQFANGTPTKDVHRVYASYFSHVTEVYQR